jgi:hypothetical protein
MASAIVSRLIAFALICAVGFIVVMGTTSPRQSAASSPAGSRNVPLYAPLVPEVVQQTQPEPAFPQPEPTVADVPPWLLEEEFVGASLDEVMKNLGKPELVNEDKWFYPTYVIVFEDARVAYWSDRRAEEAAQPAAKRPRSPFLSSKAVTVFGADND